MAENTIYTIRSFAKDIDIAPRKVSIVASLVRGRSVADALVILDHTPRRSAKPIAKAIASAKANAVNNHGLDPKTLQLTTISVTVGKRMKRFKPHMRGMALPFQKKSSHIMVEVSGQEKVKKVAPKKPATDKEKKEKEA